MYWARSTVCVALCLASATVCGCYTSEAYVLDNQQDYGVPHIRNITGQGGFTPFQYFMRSPFQSPP